MATNITFHPGKSQPSCTYFFKKINSVNSKGSVGIAEREQLLNQKGVTIWFTGLSASGKVNV